MTRLSKPPLNCFLFFQLNGGFLILTAMEYISDFENLEVGCVYVSDGLKRTILYLGTIQGDSSEKLFVFLASESVNINFVIVPQTEKMLIQATPVLRTEKETVDKHFKFFKEINQQAKEEELKRIPKHNNYA